MSQPFKPGQLVENLKVVTEALKEATRVTAIAATGLDGLYFTFHAGNDDAFYVWFNVGGVSVDPAPGGTGIEVDLAGTETAAEVAAAVAAAVGAQAGFSAVADGATVFMSDTDSGNPTDAAAGNSGFTVVVAQQGKSDTYSPGFAVDQISDDPAAF